MKAQFLGGEEMGKKNGKSLDRAVRVKKLKTLPTGGEFTKKKMGTNIGFRTITRRKA